MSLTSTYVLMGDNKWYKNPIITNLLTESMWFICYDDDDPIELVVEESLWEDITKIDELLKELKQMGYRIKLRRDAITWRPSGRIFPGIRNSVCSYSTFIIGHRYAPIIDKELHQIKHTGVYNEKPNCQGTFYKNMMRRTPTNGKQMGY